MRKKWLALLLIPLLLAGCSLQDPPEGARDAQDRRMEAKVKRVVDGDTVELENGEKVRLIGVNTPESVKPDSPVEPFAKEASDFTKKMLEGKKVHLEFDVEKRDKYGRLLAYVYLEDGVFFNALLVSEGYAQVMTVPPNVKYADRFVQLQREARENNKGLWGLEASQKANRK